MCGVFWKYSSTVALLFAPQRANAVILPEVPYLTVLLHNEAIMYNSLR